jgi:tetratricopeptide (TPR) repeat protein
MTPQERFAELIKLYTEKQFSNMIVKAKQLVTDYPFAFEAWNILAAGYKANGQLTDAENSFRKATELNHVFAEGYYNLGITLHDQGKFDEAIIAYKRAFEIDPGYALAYYNMGNTLKEQNKLDEATTAYQRAIDLNPAYAEAHNNIGNALREQKKFSSAVKHYQRAIQIKSDYTEVHYNMGIAHQVQGKLDEAIESYRHALQINPAHTESLKNMGNSWKAKGKLNEAIATYERALQLTPNDAEIYHNMGNTLVEQGKHHEAVSAYQRAIHIEPDHVGAYNGMGVALHKQSQIDEALAAYQCAIQINPDHAEVFNNMGNALKDQGNLDAAVAAYQRSIGIQPDYPSAHSNMGVTLHELGKFNEAIAAYTRAIQSNIYYAEAYNNMGITLQDQGMLDEAIAAYTRALAIKPDQADIYYGLGQTHLMKFNFAAGFELCEWRWKTSQNIGEALVSSKPKWHGQKGKVLFLWSEQGIGDEIMFSSVIPDLSICCSTLIVRCDERLIPIFKRSFSQNVYFVSKSELVPESDYDFQIAIGSALGYLRTGLESFKNSSMPYLKCHMRKSDSLRNSILNLGFNRIIGISWSTKSSKRSAQYRNVSLEQLAISAFQTDTALINLQYGDVSQQISQLQENLGISVIQISEIDNRNDIDGLGALIAACDQVVSVDNATVHLAGALGVDTKVLLPFNPDWRWGIKKSTSYWYNSLKLFHQNLPGEWDDVLVQIRKDLCSTDERNI